MSATANFFVTPRQGSANSTGSANANKTRAAADNLANVISGVAAGSVIERVTVVQNSAGAISANVIARFYIHDGTNFDLVHEVNLGAAPPTASATAIGVRITVPEVVGEKLASASHSLRVGFSAAGANDSFTVRATVADG